MKPLQALAARAAVPVFAAVGHNAQDRVDALSLAPEIEMAASPRHASILLVAGGIRAADREPLGRLHDQFPQPRATLWWGAEPVDPAGAPVTVAVEDDPQPALRDLYRRLLAGEHPSETHWLADEPPNPWRGRGDHGQGGEGMMGGTPYGRMMPMPPTPDLRDGLALDVYTTQIGPFLPQFPPGLVLEITLQGDVIQSADIIAPPFAQSDDAVAAFDRALHAPVPVAEIERARAAHHLRHIARLLGILELPGPAARCCRTAEAAEHGQSTHMNGLRWMLKVSGAFAAIPAGLGEVDAAVAQELGGPALRAAGHAIDARSASATYRDLDFSTVTQRGSDVRARLRQWLDEAGQALQLAGRAGSPACIGPDDPPETPWGRPAPALSYRFTEMLPGLEWGEALLTIASFDAAALRRMARLEDAP